MSDRVSIEVIYEMLKNVKDESLPSLHKKIDVLNGSVRKHDEEIGDLQQYRESHRGEIRGMKMIGVIVASSLGLLFAFAKIFT